MTQINPAAGLFTQLLPLLAHRAVLITVSKIEEGGRLQVNICPRKLKDSENQALTAPLCVCGTAAELDADLLPQISSFVASQSGLNSNLATIERELAEAEKAAREDAKKKQKMVGNGGKKTAEAPRTPSQEEEKKEPPAPEPLSLFDQPSDSQKDKGARQTQPAETEGKPVSPPVNYPD